MAFVIVKMKDALDEMLLDNCGLAVKKPLGDVKKRQVTQVFVVVAGELQNAEEEGTANLQVILLQQVDEQHQRLFLNCR